MAIERTGRRRGRHTEPTRDHAIRSERTLRLKLLDAESLERMKAATLRILREVGVLVEDRATRSSLILEHGCHEIDNERVAMPDDVVERVLATTPRRVMIYDREGQVTVDTNGSRAVFAPGVNCLNVLDWRTDEHRPCILADIAETARVCDALTSIGAAASLGFPADVDPAREAELTVRTLVANTVKPVIFTGHDEVEVASIWAHLAEVAGGWDALAERPCGLDLIGPTSPLKLGEETCRRLRHAAENGLPVVCYSALFPGMSGPMTLPGAIAQSTAEALAGIVIHQLARSGAPVLSGTAILPMDMRRADLAYGSPEYALAGLAAAEFLEHLGIASWVAGGCSDAHTVDAQAAAEAGMNMTLALLGPSAFVHNLGYLSAGRTGSLEMLVFCDELANMASRVGGGLVVDDAALAVDVVARAAAENRFLADAHTQATYRDAMWIPALFERSDLALWRAASAPKLRERLRTRVGEMTAGATPRRP